MLGKGTFGQVFQCLDHKKNENVALKIIRNNKRFNKQAAVEVRILGLLKSKDPDDQNHIIRSIDSFVFRKHQCITFEILGLNLYEFLKLNNFGGFSLSLVRRFSKQILTALEFTKNLNVIHCDLKPENILLLSSTKSVIKIVDFGSSCLQSEKIYTYIQSRFYRAPEIMLGIPYTTAIDMWSFGCILAELYTGNPIFPGDCEQDQLFRIMEVLGPPPSEVLDESTRKKFFFEFDGTPKAIPNSKGRIRYPGTRPLEKIIGNKDIIFFDFLSKILT